MFKKLLFVWILCMAPDAIGQIIERPLPKKHSKISLLPSQVAGTDATAESLTLPFWDDFSTSLYSPGNNLWQSGEHVRISSSIGIEAPSLNVAVFDGVDVNGRPYNPTSLLNGATDSLVSMPINLAAIAPNQADSVYLSFFWQATGQGELPDGQDSLVVQFKQTDGRWRSVWRRSGGIENQTGTFEQVLLQVTPEFFYDGFQFRIKSYTRLAGAFDTWLVDYIYLNDSRHSNDMAYLDRALTKRPSFLLNPYSAMPTEQFWVDPAKYLAETNTEFVNLNDFFQPIQFTTIVRDLGKNEQVEILNDETVANPPPGPFDRRTFTSPAISIQNLDQNADSLWLETTYYIKSGDNFYIESVSPSNDTTFNTNIDYRLNDTVRVITKIDDFFSYDDGDPDFAAGINQNGGKLAYQFFAEQRALLTHVDINFPFTQQAGEPIEITVWADIEVDGRAEDILFQESYSVVSPANIGKTISYELENPVFVQDTFYIGFQQATNEFLAVGLDKNQDSGEKMFFNVDGSWQRNESVKGSLLMHPRFDKEIAANYVPPGQPGEANLDVFPNPSQGIFTIKGNLESIKLYDSWGKAARFSIENTREGLRVNFSENQKGIYLLRVVKEGRVLTRRLILNY